jgi:hypothetical protein
LRKPLEAQVERGRRQVLAFFVIVLLTTVGSSLYVLAAFGQWDAQDWVRPAVQLSIGAALYHGVGWVRWLFAFGASFGAIRITWIGWTLPDASPVGLLIVLVWAAALIGAAVFLFYSDAISALVADREYRRQLATAP